MPRGKKSGAGGVLAVAFIGAVALLAAIPKEVWLGAAVLLAIAIAGYLYSRNRKSVGVKPASGREQASAPSKAISPPEPPAPRPASPITRAAAVAEEQPIPVRTQATAPAPSFRIPPAPETYGPARWVPAGQTVVVAGTTIPGGMIYVGTSLPASNGWDDPCLSAPIEL